MVPVLPAVVMPERYKQLRADYRELAELLGPGGLERLGLTAAERE